jgi:hypothetical protein
MAVGITATLQCLVFAINPMGAWSAAASPVHIAAAEGMVGAGWPGVRFSARQRGSARVRGEVSLLAERR